MVTSLQFEAKYAIFLLFRLKLRDDFEPGMGSLSSLAFVRLCQV